MSSADTSNQNTNLDKGLLAKQMKIFHEFSFFQERRASTPPTPAQIRAINEESGDVWGTKFSRPTPLMIQVIIT